MIYLKSTVAGLAAALVTFVVWLFTLAIATGGIGLGIDIPSWHFVLPILWSVPTIGFELVSR